MAGIGVGYNIRGIVSVRVALPTPKKYQSKKALWLGLGF